MKIVDSDSYGETAKNLLISSVVISYVGDLFIIGLLGISYAYVKNENYNKNLMKYTGGEDKFVAVRIMIFSILMFVSLVVGSLCLAASREIELSEYSDQYTDQYNQAVEIAKMFLLHFILLTTIQGFVYIYQLFYNSGNINSI